MFLIIVLWVLGYIFQIVVFVLAMIVAWVGIPIYQYITCRKYIRGLINHNKKIKQQSRDKTLTTNVKILQTLSSIVVASLSFLIFYCYIALVIFVINLIAKLFTFADPYVDQMINIGGGIGLSTLRLFHVWRLRLSFKDSAYAINNKIFIFCIIIIGISFIGCIIGTLISFDVIIVSAFHYQNREYSRLDIIRSIFAISFLMQSILDIYICYLFNKNLLSLTITRRNTIITPPIASRETKIDYRNFNNISNKQQNDDEKKDMHDIDINININAAPISQIEISAAHDKVKDSSDKKVNNVMNSPTVSNTLNVNMNTNISSMKQLNALKNGSNVNRPEFTPVHSRTASVNTSDDDNDDNDDDNDNNDRNEDDNINENKKHDNIETDHEEFETDVGLKLSHTSNVIETKNNDMHDVNEQSSQQDQKPELKMNETNYSYANNDGPNSNVNSKETSTHVHGKKLTLSVQPFITETLEEKNMDVVDSDYNTDTSLGISDGNDDDEKPPTKKSSFMEIVATTVHNATAKIEEQIANSSQSKVKLNEMQMQLIEATTKQTVLTFVAALLSLIVSIVWLGGLGDELIGIWLTMVFFAIMSATVWLSFSFAQRDYTNRCSRCHTCFLDLCQRVARLKINRLNQS